MMNVQQAQAIERGAEMSPLTIGFKLLSENAILPTKAHASDSGWDLYAAADVIIDPGETVVIPTDVAIVLPQGYEAQVRPRSGITSKTKLRVQLGTIDEEFRGNIGIIVDNISDTVNGKPNAVQKGFKIAQLVVQQLPQTVAFEITDELTETDRGGNGFGSSGV